MPPEPGIVRVQVRYLLRKEISQNNSLLLKYLFCSQTPPRILTLDNHYFPAVDEEEQPAIGENTEVVTTRPYVETQIVRHVRYKTFFILVMWI